MAPADSPDLRRAAVGVVGAGTMGSGIAQVALEAGHDVRLFDVDAAAIERGVERIRAGLARRAARNGRDRPGPHEAAPASAWVDERLARLRSVARLEELAAGTGLVVEAALEDLATKQILFAALDEASPDAVLATNTSALSVAAIAEATRRPERVLGLHFFNPAPLMALVEVVSAPGTDPSLADAAAGLVTAWGKVPVRAADAPGFIVNRVNRPFSLEPLAMLEAGDAGIEGIDAAVRAAGFPMGPFELMDLVGIDVNLATTSAIHDAFAPEGASAERFRPSPIQERLAAAGRLGRKVGEGFYTYDAEGRAGRVGGDLECPAGPSPLPPAEIVERIQVAVAAEAYRAVAAGAATRADVDLALRLGAGHPHGPFEWVEANGGPAELRRRLARLARFGPRFAVPPGPD